jgi:hypothetical protein
MRYVSFLDILGFANLVESTKLADVMGRLSHVLSAVLPTVKGLGKVPNDPRQFHVGLTVHKLTVFSFSDTFVLYSEDDSHDSFFQIVAGSKLFCSNLMSIGLPVRGALTLGEAEHIPNTQHLVGKAIVRAARLEKIQEWFGVVIDPQIIDRRHQQILDMPILKPLTVDYTVPVKQGESLPIPTRVINWRFNLVAQNGIASLFPESSNPSHQLKRQNTLDFCRWLRGQNLVEGHATGPDGKELNIPWLTGLWVGESMPGTVGKWRDEQY